MFDDFVAMAIFSIPCVIFGGLVGIALNKWAKRWRKNKRFVWATAASSFPVIAIAILAMASTKDAQISDYYYLTKDEFLRPFGIQIAMVVILTLPVAWLITRSEKDDVSVRDTFE